MTNPGFTDIRQYRDVESLNHFRILQERGFLRKMPIRFWPFIPGQQPYPHAVDAGPQQDSLQASPGSSDRQLQIY